MLIGSGVYKIINRVNSEFYIGSSIRVNARRDNHLWNLRNNKHTNSYLQNSFNKHGEENFQFIKIENVCEEKLLEREQYYIDTLHPKYNLRRIAERGGGIIGRVCSEETKRKIGNANRGKSPSQEARDKMSATRRGKFLTEEHKNNISRSLSTLTVNFKSVKQFSLDGKLLNTFNSITEASKESKVSRTHISSVCKGKRKTTGGFKWKYKFKKEK